MSKQFHDALMKHYPRLRAYAIKLTRNLHDAEDLLQNTAVLALRSEAQFAIGTSFSGWSFRIMKNSFISGCRKNSRRPISIDDAPPEYLTSVERPDDVVMVNESMRAMAKLAPAARQVLTMIYRDDYSYKDAAAALSCSMGTIKSRLWRSRAHLRTMLGVEDTSTAFRRAPSFSGAAA